MPAQKIKNYFRNPQNRFDYSRSVFNYSRTHSTNLLTGAIVPVGYINCAPGTTVPNKFGFVLQSAPLLGPSVDNAYIDIIAAWCPTRLVMADFNEWLGDNDTYAWTLGNNVHLPKITTVYDNTINNKSVSRAYFAEHYLAPHIGYRRYGSSNVGVDWSSAPSGSVFKNGIQVIPSRMYDLIYNTMFRNENIQNPVLFSKQSGSNLSLDVSNYANGLGTIKYANRLKDVFNQARLGPSIQTVDIGLGKDLPVLAADSSLVNHISGYPLHVVKYDDGAALSAGTLGVNSIGNAVTGGSSLGSPTNAIAFANLEADLSSLTVNSLYYSIMLQKYMNKASSGRRPVEFYKTMFGISRSDAAHDDPELLCQKRYKINISRVVATGNSTDGQGNLQGLGTQGAFSITSVGGTLFPEFTATEYGMLFIFAVIRTQESYSSGVDKYLTDHELLSTYLPVFDHIGEEAIEVFELDNAPASTSPYLFGYQEAWYRYRYQTNDVVGIFSPGSPMEYMTFARNLGYTTLTINDAFIKQSPMEFDRMLQLPVFYGTPNSGTGDQSVDANGEYYMSDRYQWLIQFALAGDLIATMSKDSEPLLFGSKI